MLWDVTSLDRRIARLAIPALGSIAAEPLYNLADTAIVGHLGRVPLDALAISASALAIVAWVAIFLATATTTEVARSAARNDRGAAGRAVGAAYAVAAAGASSPRRSWPWSRPTWPSCSAPTAKCSTARSYTCGYRR